MRKSYRSKQESVNGKILEMLLFQAVRPPRAAKQGLIFRKSRMPAPCPPTRRQRGVTQPVSVSASMRQRQKTAISAHKKPLQIYLAILYDCETIHRVVLMTRVHSLVENQYQFEAANGSQP